MQSSVKTDSLERYLRQSQLIGEILPFSSATLWRKVKDGTFPKPIKLGPAITAWKSSDVKFWLAKQEKASEAQ